MVSLYEFSQAINKLNKEKKFSDSLKYFKENKVQFTPEQIASNDYLIAAMLTALRQTGNYDYAFRFLEFYKITIDENTKEIILTAYGWLLYSKFKAENQLNENNQIENEIFDDEEIDTTSNHHYTKSDIIHKIEYFLPLILKVNNEFAYSVVSNLFTSVLKAEKKKPNANWKLVSDICDLISPEILHSDCTTIEIERKGQKKTMELASDKENWYAFKSKALMKLGKYQECYDISKKALELFDVFHYSNDVWFARRIAISKKYLGNISDAIIELELVVKRKKEWYIQKEIATLYQEIGEVDKSFHYALLALNNYGELEFKVDLLFLLGELLICKNENDLAFKHFSLSQLIRIKEEWRIPSKLQIALNQFKNDAISVDNFNELKKELIDYWRSFKPKINSNNNKYCGKIEKILHNDERGADGFIKYDTNKSIYFRLNSSDEMIRYILVENEVEFMILPANEEKKERAIKLKIKGKVF